MSVSTNHSTNEIFQEAIKLAGIGKKGSKPLPDDLIQEMLARSREQPASPVIQGALLGALLMKGLTDAEKKLTSATPGVAEVVTDAPEAIKKLCIRLLNHEELSREEAGQLGGFLMSDLPGEGARGLVASVLRVRYETADEYAGLWESIQQTITPAFRTPPPDGEPIIQIAEPFDGTDQSFMITPLLAQYLQSNRYRVVCLTGRNSGPKFGNNLFDLSEKLPLSTLRDSAELGEPKPKEGWYLNQATVSPALDAWVDRRRAIVKRPFLATLERFVNPVNANVLIASAFHAPYGEKMLTVAETAGFPGSIIVRNGMEGTIAFPLKRPVRLLCSARQADGQYVHQEIIFEAEKYFTDIPEMEEKRDGPLCESNAATIRKYLLQGASGDQLFDMRVKATCMGIDQAIAWVNSNIK